MYPGQTHEAGGETIPCTAEIDGEFFFLVRADCAACERQHLLLDADFHGWNGFVCHDEAKASLPRPPLVAWRCLACGGVDHTASVQIQTEGKQDFVDQVGEDFDAERWPDGFGWFAMSIRCVSCPHETGEWVSYETM
jgi:hypothetical protein